MVITIVCGLLAGFLAGDGIPYFITGSFSQDHPTHFGKSAVTNVIIGVVAFALAAVLWHFADVTLHPIVGYSSGFIGVLIVGLIHAKVWRTNPLLTGNTKRKPNLDA